jgi:hypothetical protein
MSDDLRTSAGNFDVDPTFKLVLSDQVFPPVGGSAYSNGSSRSARLSIQPSVMQRFTLLGFNINMRICALLGTLAQVQRWARWGDIWAGVFTTQPLPPASYSVQNLIAGAAFPPDLSTFAKVFDGSSDPVRMLDGNTRQTEQGTLIAGNYMFPAPYPVQPSTPLGFGLIMTPSLASEGYSSAGLVILTCGFSVLYQVETIGR